MTRDDFEAAVWQASTATGEDGRPFQLLTPARVDEILAAFDKYARATAKASREPKARAPKKPPAVHYAADGDRPACIPFDRAAAMGRALTANPSLVTCGHCLKTQSWSDASVLAGMEAFAAGGAP